MECTTVVGRSGALHDLLSAIAGAIDRRGATTWPHRSLAQDALAAARVALVGELTAEPTPRITGEVAGEITARIAGLARHAGLDVLETRILTAAVAAELEPNLHLITGLLSGDDGPARPTVAVALELAGLSPTSPDARARLAELAPLRRHGLIALDGNTVLHARRVVVPDRVAAHLLGDDMPAAATLPLLTDAEPLPLPGTETIAAALRQGHVLVWLHNPPGAAGATRILSRLLMTPSRPTCTGCPRATRPAPPRRP